jgi:hypothetical protein
MARSFYIVSGVYPRELDLSNRALPISNTITGISFASRQGPMGAYFCTDQVDFDDKYGGTDYSWTFAHGCIKAFLNKGQGIWLDRVVKNALYSGSIVSNDVEGVRATTTDVIGFPAGRAEGYATGGQEYQNLVLDGALVTGNILSITLHLDTDEPVTITQEFTTDSDTTLDAFASKLSGYLSDPENVLTDSSGVVYRPGFAGVINVNVTDQVSNRVIRVMSPQNRDITVDAMGITGGTTQAAFVLEDSPWLMEVYAIGPGKYGNDIGYKFVNVDNGVNQRVRLNFSAPLTGGSFQATANVSGQTFEIGPVPFDTNQAKTAQKIVDEFKTKLGEQCDAWVVAGSSALQIMIVSPVDGPKTLSINNMRVHDNDGIATAVTEVVAGIDRDQTFELWVYKRTNTNIVAEKHLVSLVRQVDGYGRQLFIEDAINTSGGRSDLIRIRFNHANGAGSILNVPLEGSPIYWLSGGYDGQLPTNTDIANGYNTAFGSRRRRPLRILMSGGQSSPIVARAIDNLCQKRRDCFGILDMPSNSQRATEAVEHRQGILGIASSYTAIYTPDVQIPNEETNSPIYLPPSGHVAAQFAYNDQVAAEWLSPAGLNRGIVTGIEGLREDYDEGELLLLVAAQINPIVKVPSGGYQIKEALTLQTKASALSNISVRRLLITIETTLTEALDYTIHEPNTDFTGFLIVQICTNFLQPIKDNQGLYDFAVVSDSRNTKDYDIDGGQRNVDVYLKPVLPIRFIQLTSVITKTGAFFQEIIAGLNGGTITA